MTNTVVDEHNTLAQEHDHDDHDHHDYEGDTL